MIIFLTVSLLSSIALGEEACCSLFENDEVSSSADQKADAHLGDHFCEEGSKPSSSHDEHFHFCVGCSHTPFVESHPISLFDHLEEQPINSLDYTFFVSSHYPDGPFQPRLGPSSTYFPFLF